MCPHFCSISPSGRGICGVRVNREGKLYTETYGKIAFCEKKSIESIPIYHFHPGSEVMLTGSIGCNMHCPFCDTFRFSQMGSVKSNTLTPGELIRNVKETNASGIVFGVNDPILNFEFIIDVAKGGRGEGIFIALSTNGLINYKPLKDLIPLIDAFTIGIKSWDEDFVMRKCGGKMMVILDAIEHIQRAGTHLEISYLLIPNTTDKSNLIKPFLEWISLKDKNIPVHFLNYEPAFQYSLPAMPVKKTIPIYEEAKKLLPFVYISNLHNEKMNQTICPSCKTPAVERKDFKLISSKYDARGRCLKCGESLNLIPAKKQIEK